MEVFLNGAWGTVCNDGWDLDDAAVVCRSLGFARATEALSSAAFGQGVGLQILLDDVDCDGDEETIFECQHRGIGDNNCGHSEDAGVRCGKTNDGLNGNSRSVDGSMSTITEASHSPLS